MSWKLDLLDTVVGVDLWKEFNEIFSWEDSACEIKNSEEECIYEIYEDIQVKMLSEEWININ